MSDVVEVSVALLRRFADFTKKLTPEQLAALANGELKFGLFETAKIAAKPMDVDPATILSRLEATGSRAEAGAYIDGLKLSAPGLKQLARALATSLTGATTKAQVRDRIVEHTVGVRLNSLTIRTGDWNTRG